MIPYILSNEKYIGAVYMQKYFNSKFKTFRNNIDYPATTMYAIENHHEPIISNDMFEKAKKKLSSRAQRVYDKRRNNKDFLSEFIVCGKCGNHYKRIIRKNKDGEEKVTYRCGKNRYKSECCHNTTLYLKIFESLFIKTYNQFTKITSIDEKSIMLNCQLDNINSHFNDLQRAYNLKNITSEKFDAEYKPLIKKHGELRTELYTHLKHIINGQKIPFKIQKYREDLLKIVIEKVEINDTHVDFHFINGVIIEAEMEKSHK